VPSNACVRQAVLLLCASTLFATHVCMAQTAGPDMTARGGNHRERMELVVGEQRVLDADNVRSFSEGTKGVIDIRLTKDNERFVIVATKPGVTTLLFLMMDGTQVNYEVTVSDPSATPLPARDAVLKRDNIRLDFYFVQLSNTYTHSLGIGWPTSIEGRTGINVAFNLQYGALSGASAVVSSTILPRLDFAQANGWAKVMRRAAVITANGTQANFNGGGEVNVRIAGGFGGSIKAISYGSQINVRPRYDKETGRIELDLSADVSDLTSDNGTGAPGRITSTLQTIVNLELGQSVMLAGLTSESESKSRSGIPGLSQIPILGGLFGTHTEQSSETQNVIFIVPTVLDVVSMQQRAMIEEALQSYDDYSGSLNYRRGLIPERARTP
jgi:pilus assembly protein CpaC